MNNLLNKIKNADKKRLLSITGAIILGIIVVVSVFNLSQKKDYVVTGLTTTIVHKGSKSITDKISIDGAKKDTVILLQQYDDSSKDWTDVEQFTADKDGTVKLKYPDVWKKHPKTTWRLHIDKSMRYNEYNQEVTINARNVEKVDLYCKAAVVLNADTYEVIYDSNMDTQTPIASVTKLMTVLVCLENCKLDDKVTVTHEALGINCQVLYFREGDQYTVESLLHALMLPSSNDAAVALAIHVGGSLDGFNKMMNEKAKELGLTNSHFNSPSGLTNDDHYSSAYDMSIVHAELLKHQIFRDICKKETYKVNNITKDNEIEIRNSNKLLGTKGVLTGKTGFTTPAGHCVSISYEHNGKTYIITVLNGETAESRWIDCESLIEYINQYDCK